jgi:hypothetical protein
MEAIKAAERAAPVEKRINYVEAAEQIKALLGLGKPAAKSETGAPAEETVMQERD